MAQHDFNIDNQSAPAFRGDLNNALEALGTLSSGATAPATTYANMLWYDTANNILKMRSEADDAWIALGTLDQSANTFAPAGVAELTQVQAEDDTSTVFGQVSGQRLGQAIAATPTVDVATAIAALPLNGVGTYAMLCRTLTGSDGDVTKGDTYAGSSLFFLGPLGRTSSTSNGYYGRVHTAGLSGTWMATGTHSSTPIGSSNDFYQGQLWLRIA